MVKPRDVELIQIVNLLVSTADAPAAQPLQSHVDSGCAHCAEGMAAIEQYTEFPSSQSDVRSIDAQPLLDTQLVQPLTSGVRSGATLVRRRVYEAEGKICIDVQHRESVPGSSILDGHVLVRGGSADDVADCRISLWSGDGRIHETKADALGDFTISNVPSGCYDLVVSLDNACRPSAKVGQIRA